MPAVAAVGPPKLDGSGHAGITSECISMYFYISMNVYLCISLSLSEKFLQIS